MAVALWKDPKMRWASAAFVIYVFLTGFSRNYLGVHTPQDVCVGLLISVLSIYLAGKLLVDPQKMMNDGYGDLGKGLGFIIGYFIEKTWIRFKPFKGGAGYTAVCLAGLIPMV